MLSNHNYFKPYAENNKKSNAHLIRPFTQGYSHILQDLFISHLHNTSKKQVSNIKNHTSKDFLKEKKSIDPSLAPSFSSYTNFLTHLQIPMESDKRIQNPELDSTINICLG